MQYGLVGPVHVCLAASACLILSMRLRKFARMRRKWVVFSDIDGTLIHRTTDGTNGNDAVAILDGKHGEHGVVRYISRRTQQLIRLIQDEGHLFVCITGRRQSSFAAVASFIPHDFSLCENGGVVLCKTKHTGDNLDDGQHKRGEVDRLGKQWEKHLEQSVSALWEYEDQLRSEGYSTDSKGMRAKFRVFVGSDPKDAGTMTEEQKRALEIKIRDEAAERGLESVRMIDFLDVMPSAGGKANALAFVMHRLGIPADRAICLGDDMNDLSMLTAARWAACPGNAREQVKSVCQERGHFVSTLTAHAGTVDILSYAISAIRTSQNPCPPIAASCRRSLAGYSEITM
jgi:HAD superfamily hydrolase (TIGR01484 family)